MEGSETHARARDGAKKGFRLPVLNEFIYAMMEDRQYSELRDGIYWMGRMRRLGFSGFCRIDYERCRLVPVSNSEWHNLDAREKGYVYGRNRNMAIKIRGIGKHDSNMERLSVYADGRPSHSTRIAYISNAKRALRKGVLPVLRNG